MKTKKIMMFLLAIVTLTVTILLITKSNHLHLTVNEIEIRELELVRKDIDYQNVIDNFDESALIREGSTITFVGTKGMNKSDFSGFDNLSQSDTEYFDNIEVKYYFSYDSSTNIVKISAETKNDFGEIELDEIYGYGFINEYNEIDAVMNIEGTSITLSEMSNMGLLENAGFFSKLIKAVTVTAVVAATAAIVVATAGAAAPAVMAVGIGLTTTQAVAAAGAAGIAAGIIFSSTIGNAAIKAGTAIAENIGPELDMIVEKVTGSIIEFIHKGVSYATKAMTASLVQTIDRYQYFLALVGKDNQTYISVLPVSQTEATIIARGGMSIYTFLQSNAYKVAYDAGNKSPRFEPAHGISKGLNFYFDHYHPNRSGSEKAHVWFGTPVY